MLDECRGHGYSFTMNRFRAIMDDMRRGYGNLAVRTGFTLLALAGLTLVSAAMALPLWALATFAKPVYSYFVLVVIAVWILATLFFDWRKSLRQGTPVKKLMKKALTFSLKAGTAILGILAVPVIAGVIQAGQWHIAIPMALVYLFVAGLVFFAKSVR